ncbi:hypothetical protein QQG09_03180 [Melissococcus plutonius]|uniref:Uncharacterized protein n=1 Tax=Melissococcus plutonius TaxID=33970 RepID=A0A2Z5Y1K4_9ENTE|nr:hypothetical protein [Melissococcus plutonius]BAL61868.1 hypothetical protein MPD5_0602 [Melissococcus plutonius DAT561]MCV2499314.1 hypothetical protein [Melissococcus plutonius]MCV2500957.1 hypothetical protein [Melissococcus plutonius]MCV2505615.1 hypothetical protein [Melissococcus plutonius]MCV2507922.1 hypothetical protein [Melissococcus plutonius]
MHLDYLTDAKNFLAGLTKDEQAVLYNDLLALQEVHQTNEHRCYYTLRNVKGIAKKYSKRRTRSFSYQNAHSDELLIYQTHEQHFLKNTYHIQIFFNKQKYPYDFIVQLLVLLKQTITESMVSYPPPTSI